LRYGISWRCFGALPDAKAMFPRNGSVVLGLPVVVVAGLD
jgi:hypothetical protein